ncbi:MAG TPA: hypothetical protein VIY28_03750 [Pseudonocardiaceae bacterium]
MGANQDWRGHTLELLPTTDGLPTIDGLLPAAGKPPTPGPIRVVERWRVAWQGRRDANRPADVDRPRPYLESLRAHAEAAQGSVSRWLHSKIIPLDREAAHLLIVLEQYRRDPAIPPETTIPTRSAADEADPRPVGKIPQWVREAREVAALQNAYRRRIRERNEAEQRLGELGSTRQHLIAVARAAANAHISRYEQLVALYETARRRDQAGDDLRRAVSTEPWVRGDMPLLALEVDSQFADSYRWFLKEFETRTSELERPSPDKVPRPS